MAVPGALVPATLSAQRAPSTKFIAPARRRAAAWPSTHNSLPWASQTASRCSPSVAYAPMSSRITGIARASGCASR